MVLLLMYLLLERGAADDEITTIIESVTGKESVFIKKSHLLSPKGVLKLQ